MDIKEEWENSSIAQRVQMSELCAINHGSPEWGGETIADWWIKKMDLQKREVVEEILKEIPSFVKLPDWSDNSVIHEVDASSIEDTLRSKFKL